MYLTTENASQYVGKSLDCNYRRFHYYPLRVIKHGNGKFYYIDRIGVMSPVPPPEDTFNSVYFEFIVYPISRAGRQIPAERND